MKKVTFFDVDGTLYCEGLIIEVSKKITIIVERKNMIYKMPLDNIK